ncbi:MAG: hypothetical protein CO129_00415 [Ignavibacteriales bacterium CG_4_9_14_3_um_filter_34_10]|nr:MAG: hypothetical protein CO129_00415 [Ignavibacteriales bacterium CG_4_9_14_3_um_filter_34_10]
MMKKLNIIFYLFLLLNFSLLAQEMDPEAGKFYNEGNKFLKSGQLKEALSSYDNALKSSNDYRIHYQRGLALKQMSNYKAAEESFEKSVQINPKFDLGYNALGGTYFVDGSYDKSVEAFKKFEELTQKKNLKDKAKENISRAYTKLGDAAKKDGNYEKAISYLNEAVKNYNSDFAFLSLSEAYVEMAKYDEAIQSADKAINHRKNISKGAAFYYKGLAFKGKGDLTKAKENFNQALGDPVYKKNAEYQLNLMK